MSTCPYGGGTGLNALGETSSDEDDSLRYLKSSVRYLKSSVRYLKSFQLHEGRKDMFLETAMQVAEKKCYGRW